MFCHSRARHESERACFCVRFSTRESVRQENKSLIDVRPRRSLRLFDSAPAEPSHPRNCSIVNTIHRRIGSCVPTLGLGRLARPTYPLERHAAATCLGFLSVPFRFFLFPTSRLSRQPSGSRGVRSAIRARKDVHTYYPTIASVPRPSRDWDCSAPSNDRRCSRARGLEEKTFATRSRSEHSGNTICITMIQRTLIRRSTFTASLTVLPSLLVSSCRGSTIFQVGNTPCRTWIA